MRKKSKGWTTCMMDLINGIFAFHKVEEDWRTGKGSGLLAGLIA